MAGARPRKVRSCGLHRSRSRSYGRCAGRSSALPALIARVCACFAPPARPRGRRAAGEDRGAGRFAHRRLRPAGRCRVSGAARKPRSRPRASPSSIANAGVSGDTASGGLGRLDWSVPDGTDAVILELGANDALRGIDPKVTKAALEEIVGRLDARHIAVLLAGMLAPRNLGADYVQAFDAIYPELAATIRSSSIRSSSTGWRPTPSSIRPTACTRPRRRRCDRARGSCRRSRR